MDRENAEHPRRDCPGGTACQNLGLQSLGHRAQCQKQIVGSELQLETMQLHIYLYIYIHTYTHTYIYIYMHTEAFTSRFGRDVRALRITCGWEKADQLSKFKHRTSAASALSRSVSHVHETFSARVCWKMRAPRELDPKTNLKTKQIFTTMRKVPLHLRSTQLLCCFHA